MNSIAQILLRRAKNDNSQKSKKLIRCCSRKSFLLNQYYICISLFGLSGDKIIAFKRSFFPDVREQTNLQRLEKSPSEKRAKVKS